MMRSLFTGISGLKVHQTKMDVIANNIANVNTVGYKSSRITFNEFFAQNLSGASGANEDTNSGGRNPMQIGLGVAISSIDTNMTPGAAQRTDKPFDLMVSGEGFFIVGDSSGTYFTRAGAFRLDDEYNLVNPNGMKLMGWDAYEDPLNPGQMKIAKEVVKPIQLIGDKRYVDPKTTKNVAVTGNLNAIDDKEQVTTMAFYDTLGNRYVVDVKMMYNDTTKKWAYNIGDMAYPDGDRDNAFQITVATTGITFTAAKPTDTTVDYTSIGDIEFDEFGKVKTTPTEFKLTINPGTVLNPNAAFGDGGAAGTPGTIKIDFSALTQFAEKGNATTTTLDGNAPGSLNNVSIGADGSIVGQYSNGQTKIIGKIPVAKFINPEGLEKVGSSLYRTTINSGDFDGVGVDVTSGGGEMIGGALEMSNVDLSSEFTDMITTQRGFQANSRTITTSDEMLQELVNLKR